MKHGLTASETVALIFQDKFPDFVISSKIPAE
jgi:hypothetical protein